MKGFYKNNCGLTLVELLISLAIGAGILSAGIVVFLDQVQSSRRLTAYSHMQESGRVALDIIERDIRMGGFTGCFSTNTVLNNFMSDSYPASFQPDSGIQGWEADSSAPGAEIDNVLTTTQLVDVDDGGWSSSAGSVIDSMDIVPNSDIIRVWGGGDVDFSVGAITLGAAPTLSIPLTSNIIDDAILILSDCENADIVQACEVVEQGGQKVLRLNANCSPGNDTSKVLKTDIAQNPTVTLLNATTYVVSKQNGVLVNPPSLFRIQLDTAGAVLGEMQEVVQGVESMQILYGENSDGDSRHSVDAYVTANNVQDWKNVISVRVSLLLQSVDNNLVDGASPYVFNGVNYNGQSGNPSAADRRVRRVFSRTITLRNRTLGS